MLPFFAASSSAVNAADGVYDAISFSWRLPSASASFTYGAFCASGSAVHARPIAVPAAPKVIAGAGSDARRTRSALQKNMYAETLPLGASASFGALAPLVMYWSAGRSSRARQRHGRAVDGVNDAKHEGERVSRAHQPNGAAERGTVSAQQMPREAEHARSVMRCAEQGCDHRGRGRRAARTQEKEGEGKGDSPRACLAFFFGLATDAGTGLSEETTTLARRLVDGIALGWWWRGGGRSGVVRLSGVPQPVE